MQVLFHKHVWLYSEYMPTLHWWTGASSVTLCYNYYMRNRIWHNYPSLIHGLWAVHILFVATVTITIKPKILLLPLLPLLSYYFATKYLAVDIKFPGVVELTTQLLILQNILWLPLCRINEFGLNTLPSIIVAIPYTCGLSPEPRRTSSPCGSLDRRPG